jgi:cytochrome P450
MISEEAERMFDGLAGKRIDLKSSMMEFALRVVCRALFGQAFSGNIRRISRAIRTLQEGVLEPKLLPAWMPTPGRLRREQMTSMLNREIYAIIDNTESDKGSLLGHLKTLTDDDGSMSRQQLRDEVVTLFLAGHETTALALTWTLYLLSLHPEAEERVAEELRRVQGTGPPVVGKLAALEYTERCIKEAMRLYPPVFVIPRVCVRPVQIAGFRVEPNAEVWCWTYFMQRDPRWFQLPDRFDPDRFIP